MNKLSTRKLREQIRERVLTTFPENSWERNQLLWLTKYLRLLGFLKYPGESSRHETAKHAPQVSIIIPSFNNASLTFRCIANIRTFPTLASYEIIVVDDGSSRLQALRLRKLSGITLVKLKQNVGYLRATNVGIQKAVGRFTVLLNNDTLPQPGWLDALIGNFNNPDVGLVGSKLVYPNGVLQEAGGIIFSDGSTANYGRGDDPQDARYAFRREAHYCSGAAIAVRSDLLAQLGGYDDRYQNAYYEDTDLAMSIRAMGFRVIYEPRSVVVHIEHGSYNDQNNQPVTELLSTNKWLFETKWRDELQEFSPPTTGDLALVSMEIPDTVGNVLVIDSFPRWKHDSGALRLHEIISWYLAHNLGVILVSDLLTVERFYTEELERHGVHIIDAHHQGLSNFLVQIESTLIHAHVARVRYMHYFMSSLASSLKKVPLFYDTVDLHFLRHKRKLELIDADAPRRRIHEVEMLETQELRFIRQADVVAVVSPIEMQLLEKLGVADNVVLLPNTHRYLEKVNHTVEKREGLLFVGNFNHSPNEDGVKWFLSEVYPLIQNKLGDIPLTIVGAPGPFFLKSPRQPNVTITGWVEDLTPQYAKARVAIAPLRWGAGIKGKIGEAWSHGLPVVTTDIGAEGMDILQGEHALIANDPVAFASCVEELLTNDELWESLSQKGRQHVEQNFGLDAFSKSMENILDYIPTDLSRSPKDV